MTETAMRPDIQDRTAVASAILKQQLADHLIVLKALIGLYDRELISAAVAELSEILVAKLERASREKRTNRGYDIKNSSGEKIEVKSRISTKWGNNTQYNFRTHSRDAHIAYCLSWRFSDSDLLLDRVFYARMDHMKLLNTRSSKYFYVRTTLGQMQKAMDSSE